MLAIYDGTIYSVGDDLNTCLLLDYTTGTEMMRVDYGNPTLIVDPTDDQVEAARTGQPIPPETCAICQTTTRHAHEWCYWTRDGYGVCDTCGGAQ